MEFQNKVIEKNDDTEDDLATIQRNIENAARGGASHESRERHFREYTRECETT